MGINIFRVNRQEQREEKKQNPPLRPFSLCAPQRARLLAPDAARTPRRLPIAIGTHIIIGVRRRRASHLRPNDTTTAHLLLPTTTTTTAAT